MKSTRHLAFRVGPLTVVLADACDCFDGRGLGFPLVLRFAIGGQVDRGRAENAVGRARCLFANCPTARVAPPSASGPSRSGAACAIRRRPGHRRPLPRQRSGVPAARRAKFRLRDSSQAMSSSTSGETKRVAPATIAKPKSCRPFPVSDTNATEAADPTFMQYDPGFVDHETSWLEPAESPFGAKLLPMSPE